MSTLCHAFDVSHDGRNKPKPQANGSQASKKGRPARIMPAKDTCRS